MKVGIIAGTPSFGGISRTAMEAASGLTRLGFDVNVIFLVKSHSIPVHEELYSAVSHTYLYESKYLTSTAGEALSRALYLTRSPKESYDLLITYQLAAARVAFQVWKEKRCPYVCVHHDPGTYQFTDPLQILFRHSDYLAKKYESTWLSNAALIVTNSKRNRERLKSHTGLESTVLYPSSSLVGQLSKDGLPCTRDQKFLTVHRLEEEYEGLY